LNNDKLYKLIKKLIEIYDITIYIQTWNIFQNSISWRYLEENNKIVHDDIFKNYFRDLYSYIKFIMILDDTQIKLIGNTNGYVCNTMAPLVGWKNMWYGKYQIINKINDDIFDKKTIIINTRFDILTNSFNYNIEKLILFINKQFSYLENDTKYNKIFFINEKKCGLDNFYIGFLESIYIITSKFYNNLDYIMSIYPDLSYHPEFLVYYEKEKLLNTPK
jgi:hypothetical protein